MISREDLLKRLELGGSSFDKIETSLIKDIVDNSIFDGDILLPSKLILHGYPFADLPTGSEGQLVYVTDITEAYIKGTTWKSIGPYQFTNTEASDLVARMTVPPTEVRKELIDTTIGSLKTAGIWDQSDGIYFTAAHDSQASLLNWKQDLYNLTAVNGPTFVVDRGWQNTSAGLTAQCRLDPNFNPTTETATCKYQKNADIFGFYTDTDGQNSGNGDAGINTGSALFLNARTTSDKILSRNNQTTSNTSAAATDARGLTITSRNSGDILQHIYKNGSLLASGNNSSAIPNAFVWFLRCQGTNSPRQFQFGIIGGDITGTLGTTLAHSTLYDIVTNYVDALGVEVF